MNGIILPMTPELAKQLEESVRIFYEQHGAAFAATRGCTWEEERLVSRAILPGMTVADIGAGNSRFARLLDLTKINYLAFEPSSALRHSDPPPYQGEAGGDGFPSVSAALPHIPLPDNSADVIVCFAVLQHIPTFAARQKAVAELIRLTKPGGLIAATSWFLTDDDPRARKVDGGERGDVWVAWQAEKQKAERYVHVMNEIEWQQLWSHPQLKPERSGLFGKQTWTDDPTEARNWFVLARKTILSFP